MLDYHDFWTIADYGNRNWKGNFAPWEVAQNAYDYKVEYDESIQQGKPTRVMVELCKLLYEDMGGEMPSEFTITNMKGVLNDFLYDSER